MTDPTTVPPVPGSAAWWRQRYGERSRRRPRVGGLTLAAITDAALAIADHDGLDALTMRRLAERLGTRHTSLYRHVASREELLVELVDRVLAEVRLPVDGPDWRTATEAGAREFRRVLRHHPAVAPLFVAGQLLGPHALRAREQGLGLLIRSGWTPESAVHAYLTVMHFVIGAAQLDAGGAARTAAERMAMAALFASLPADTHPVVRAHAELLNAPDSDQEFDFGLQALLDGLDRRREAP
ncbi:TetR/AcrR family transcriptional regulator [Kitasatospora paracochleata]|uniref:AcrR family transcriptional regulator n=1 Tax=Kitasatospora paracochleata TaxID=58354 RepID=A0ABT1J143_9ACTN|nr:TetR/AcrR family transcriptional regulator C-terminal domain-containing protein [Kitasatospora paracochleata]MCP2311136.1 AcrR family transcriptional regulator [Kitasatospora paracochleata]